MVRADVGIDARVHEPVADLAPAPHLAVATPRAVGPENDVRVVVSVHPRHRLALRNTQDRGTEAEVADADLRPVVVRHGAATSTTTAGMNDVGRGTHGEHRPCGHQHHPTDRMCPPDLSSWSL